MTKGRGGGGGGGSKEEVHFLEEVMTVTTPILLVPSRFPQWRVSGLSLEVGFVTIGVYLLNNVYVELNFQVCV